MDLIKQFGRTARGERLERIRKSPHFVNDKFQNEEVTTLFTGQGGMLKNLGKFLFGKKPKNRIPRLGEIPVIKTDLNCLPESGDFYLWFGHSSFLLRLDGKTILADPVFHKGSPVSFVNRAFPGTDLYKPNDMPKEIDFLLISHDHWDHLDYQTVSELKDRVKKVVCPLGVGENFEYWGYDKQQLIELDWYESATSNGLTFHCLPTQHFSGRGFWKAKTMPASWLMESTKRKVFFSGDGGYSSRFKRFGSGFPTSTSPSWRTANTTPTGAKSTPCPSNWEKPCPNFVQSVSSPSTIPSSVSPPILGTSHGKTSARRRSNLGFS